MSTRGDVASTSVVSKDKKSCRTGTGTDRICLEKPTELLIESKFRECFHISNDISMHLVDGASMSTE